MASSPSHLPDLCLENIFKRVPLIDLLRSVRLVCSNWNRLAPTEIRGRRSVVLLQHENNALDIQKENQLRSGDLMQHVRREDGSPWAPLRPLDQIWFDALLVPGGDGLLTEGFTTELMDTLPGICHMTVMQAAVASDSTHLVLEEIIRLLRYYTTSLVSLKIYFSDYVDVEEEELDDDELNEENLAAIDTSTLLDSINRLHSLRHLTLNVTLSNMITRAPNLSILSRLNTFTSNNGGALLLMHSFRQHPTGNVRIDSAMYWSLDKMNALGPLLASKFASASIASVFNYEDMHLFGARFTNLTALSMIDGDVGPPGQMPMTMLARCLSPLSQLIYLKVTFRSNLAQEDMPQLELTPLTSIRLFSVTFHSTSHLDTERLCLDELFPSLQVLESNQQASSCAECDLADIGQMLVGPNMNAEVRNRIEQCLRLARVPFRRCASLHTIKLRGNVRALLPRRLVTPDEL